MQEGPDSPITRFTSVNVVPDSTNINDGDFFGFPRLTQAQIDSIPEENLLPGIVIFNIDYNVYMAYMEGRWNNINTSLTYQGAGYEIGSPFALPAGPASIIESSPNNMDPGVMYVNTENNDQPRIYIPSTGWVDVAMVGGGSPTFDNITVTGTTTTSTLTVTGTLYVYGDLAVNINTDLIGYTTMFGGTTCTSLQIGGANIESGPVGFFAGTTGVAYSPGFSFSYGSASGEGASATLEGSPLSGIFTLTTGTTPAADAIIATFTLFNSYLYDAPFGVIVTPANKFAASVTNSVYAYVSVLSGVGSAQFVMMTSPGMPLTASTIYSWNYMIISNTQSIG